MKNRSVLVTSNNINWKQFARTYLLSAKISILKRIELESGSSSRISEDIKYRLESGLILIPVIYSIRHALELLLKSIGVKLNSEIIKSHDITTLVQELSVIGKIDEDKKDKLLKLIIKYTKYNFNIELFKNSEIDLNNEFFRFPHIVNTNKIMGENLKHIQSSDILNDIETLEAVIDIDGHIRN
jgi:hypothetical protein